MNFSKKPVSVSNLLKWLMYVLFFQEGEVVGWGLFALLAPSFSNTCRMCSVKLWPTWEMKGIMWFGGLGVTIASRTCKTSWESFHFLTELVASANGNQCICDQRTWVVVEEFCIDWSRSVVPRALWGSYELLLEWAPLPSPTSWRVLFLCLCNRALSVEAMHTGRGRICAGSRTLLSLGSAGTNWLFAMCLMKALHSLSLVFDGCP